MKSPHLDAIQPQERTEPSGTLKFASEIQFYSNWAIFENQQMSQKSGNLDKNESPSLLIINRRTSIQGN